jgi:uncharacterized membrane protein YphA (DoxX/SURF4 family)
MMSGTKRFAPTVLRLGLSVVFLWFGINQLLSPDLFLGYVPSWMVIDPSTLILVNGVFETVAGMALLLGLFTRLCALAFMVHLVLIIIGLGYNDVAVRDVGLLLATLSVFLQGSDAWCLDTKLFRG